MASFDAERYLGSLEPIGWRLGLERMRKLSAALGMPQHRFASVHVVGTNGKSSVARMTAALLGAHGLRDGASLSPHVSRWAERTLVGGEAVAPGPFAEAVEAVARAVEGVDRTLEPGEAVTQFEAATAASFLALARARVQAAAIEAGLGGRLDATNTIPSRVTVLTSVGLDHTEWLGESELEIAAEKLAVLRDQTTLVLGRVSGPVRELAARTAAERGARLVEAPRDPGPGVRLRAAGPFQRRNFALAMAAAEAFLGELDRERAVAVAAALAVPGRLERLPGEPPALLDAAHNPDGAAALAEALPEVGGGPVVACLAMLAEKDAAAFVAALAPGLRAAVCSGGPAGAGGGRGWHRAEDLARACAAVGLEAEVAPDYAAAIARARRLAAAEPGGTVLATGSHYALGPARELLSIPPGERDPGRLCED